MAGQKHMATADRSRMRTIEWCMTEAGRRTWHDICLSLVWQLYGTNLNLMRHLVHVKLKRVLRNILKMMRLMPLSYNRHMRHAHLQLLGFEA